MMQNLHYNAAVTCMGLEFISRSVTGMTTTVQRSGVQLPVSVTDNNLGLRVAKKGQKGEKSVKRNVAVAKS